MRVARAYDHAGFPLKGRLTRCATGGAERGPAPAAEIIGAFLSAEFTGEERHTRRLGTIDAIEREFAR